MRKTHDYHYEYRGLWHDGGGCRIEVYAPEASATDHRPVIVAIAPDDNARSSVTHMAEYLASEVVARHFPHLLDAPAAGDSRSAGSSTTRPGAGCRGRTAK